MRIRQLRRTQSRRSLATKAAQRCDTLNESGELLSATSVLAECWPPSLRLHAGRVQETRHRAVKAGEEDQFNDLALGSRRGESFPRLVRNAVVGAQVVNHREQCRVGPVPVTRARSNL